MTERLELDYLVDAAGMQRLREFMEPYVQRRQNAMIIPTSLFALAVTFMVFRLQGIDIRVAAAITFGTAVFVGIIQYVYWRTGALHVMRGAFQDLGEAFNTKPTHYHVRIDEDGITFRTGLRARQLFWHNIAEWSEDGDAWLLRDGSYGLFVPRDAFTSKREFAAFTALAHERLAEEQG